MTDRERWTVYPLLFLALGVSLKDKLTETVSTKDVRCETMVCNELLVTNPKGPDRFQVQGGKMQTTTMTVTDPDGKQRVNVISGTVQSANLVCNALVVADVNGKEVAAVAQNENGGFVRTVGTQTGTVAFLGNTDQIAGLLFIDSHGAVHAGPFFASPLPTKKPAAAEPTPPAKPADAVEEQLAAPADAAEPKPEEDAPKQQGPNENSSEAKPE